MSSWKTYHVAYDKVKHNPMHIELWSTNPKPSKERIRYDLLYNMTDAEREEYLEKRGIQV